MPILFDIAIPSLEIPHFIPCQGNNQKWSQRFVNQENCLRHTDQKIKIKTKVKQIGVGLGTPLQTHIVVIRKYCKRTLDDKHNVQHKTVG